MSRRLHEGVRVAIDFRLSYGNAGCMLSDRELHLRIDVEQLQLPLGAYSGLHERVFGGHGDALHDSNRYS